MRLSLHTDYALRVLMYLAAEERKASVDEIARAYGISHNHLVKVARRLVALGLIDARRGRGGGISLAQTPGAINIGRVVRQMENLGGFVECFDAVENGCPVAGVCGLQGALALALGDFLKRLDCYVLSDLVPNKAAFARRLEASNP
ncbi:MAG: Rrf2 family transcriptional regulator [Sphingomicrobium sp.]